MGRAERLRGQLSDIRGGRVVFCSHCILNENVRYLGGAGRRAAVDEVINTYLADGVGIVQMPCPEQHALGGVLRRRRLLAYGSAGTVRAPAARLLLRPFVWYTWLAYARIATRELPRMDHAIGRSDGEGLRAQDLTHRIGSG